MIDLKSPNRVFTTTGIIPSGRMTTLFGNPFAIALQNNNIYNAIIPLNFIIRISVNNYTPGVINNFLYGFSGLITAQLPSVNGAFGSLNNPLPDLCPVPGLTSVGFYTLGVRQSTQHINWTTGSTIEFMADSDDLGASFNDCNYWFTYSTFNF